MGKTEKPKSSWRERKKDIKQNWLRPLIFVEWLCERLSYFLGRWALLDILGHAGRFVIIVALISYIWEAEGRRKARHYQAWQVINAAQGKPGSGGRIDALEDLNKDKVPLDGVDISKAYLTKLNLSGAHLFEANLTWAFLINADLSGAELWSTNLFRAILLDANLSGAWLSKENLSGAHLGRANIIDIHGWEDIKSIEFANIHDVKNPPDGFIEWAKNHGAVETEDFYEWKAMLIERGVWWYKND